MPNTHTVSCQHVRQMHFVVSTLYHNYTECHVCKASHVNMSYTHTMPHKYVSYLQTYYVKAPCHVNAVCHNHTLRHTNKPFYVNMLYYANTPCHINKARTDNTPCHVHKACHVTIWPCYDDTACHVIIRKSCDDIACHVIIRPCYDTTHHAITQPC